MENNLEQMMQESESEWADIEKKIAFREKLDKKIISIYCSQNKEADIIHIVELLEKYNGMPLHDKEIIASFKNEYPENLKVRTIHDFLDIQDIYKAYLESGGEADE